LPLFFLLFSLASKSEAFDGVSFQSITLIL